MWKRRVVRERERVRESEHKLELSTHSSVFYRRGSHGPRANVCRGFSQTFQPLTDIRARKYYTSHPVIFSVLVLMLLNTPSQLQTIMRKCSCGFVVSNSHPVICSMWTILLLLVFPVCLQPQTGAKIFINMKHLNTLLVVCQPLCN